MQAKDSPWVVNVTSQGHTIQRAFISPAPWGPFECRIHREHQAWATWVSWSLVTSSYFSGLIATSSQPHALHGIDILVCAWEVCFVYFIINHRRCQGCVVMVLPLAFRGIWIWSHSSLSRAGETSIPQNCQSFRTIPAQGNSPSSCQSWGTSQCLVSLRNVSEPLNCRC